MPGGAASAATSPACVVPSAFRILDERVTESSGLVVSARHPHTVWTANDSGDTGRVFAVDTRTGRTVGLAELDAPVTDVEALALTPDGRLLVGDLGDNTRSRDSVRIHVVDEPALGTTRARATTWTLRYPDGPHDAEALAVDPTDGRVVVVTKDAVGGVYELPGTPSARGVNTLRRVGDAPATVTDAAYLPDGSALVVRTYTSAIRLDPATFRVTGSRFLPLQPQGETLAAWPCGDVLLVGSEGTRSAVKVVAVPTASAGATTTTTSSSSAAPGSTSVSSGRPATAGSPARDTGWVAWGAAGLGLVVLGAGVGAWLRGRRRQH